MESSVNVTLLRDAKVGKTSSENTHTCRHISMPWSRNTVTCGPILVLAVFPHRTSHGGCFNEDRGAICVARRMQGKLPFIIHFIDNRSQERTLDCQL